MTHGKAEHYRYVTVNQSPSVVNELLDVLPVVYGLSVRIIPWLERMVGNTSKHDGGRIIQSALIVDLA